jgi:hypothetical protein
MGGGVTMFIAFQIQSPQGVFLRQYPEDTNIQTKTAEFIQEVQAEPWHQISYHHCYHDEGKPCEPWEVVAEKGEIPTSDL